MKERGHDGKRASGMGEDERLSLPRVRFSSRSLDELSELEEFIDQCCHEAARRGFRIWPGVTIETVDDGGEVCCPLGAVGVVTRQWWDELTVFQAFIDGFDGTSGPDKHRNKESFQMGARFRTRWLAGECVPP